MSSPDKSDPVAGRRKAVNWLQRSLRWLFLFAGIPYLAIIAFFGVAQRSLIYQPTRNRSLSADTVSDATMQVSDVQIAADNDVVLHGWHFRPANPSNLDRKYLVIYFCGNGGCRADRVQDCRDFTMLGCDVLLFDYRGYGDNEGSPTEAFFAADAKRVWLFARDQLQFQPNQILLFGESLGGAVATRLAYDLSVSKEIPGALILNSTFASLAETGGWHYPALPVRFLLLDRFSSVTRIPAVLCPILHFHGTADEVVPYKHGQRLFQAAPERSSNGIEKQFFTIEGGHHNFISVGHMQSAVSSLMKRLNDMIDDFERKRSE